MADNLLQCRGYIIVVGLILISISGGSVAASILARGFGCICCPTCGVDKLLTFSSKGRGFRTSYGTRRMSEAAASLVDTAIPLVSVRQFVVTFPPPLRLWLARGIGFRLGTLWA